MNKLIASCLIAISSMTFLSCSSDVKKADISNSANPQQEIAKMDADLDIASSKNIDVLARNDFMESTKWLDEAKADQANRQKQDEVLDDVRKARGFLEKAYQTAQNRAEKAPGLFEARQMALKAGAGKQPELKKDLERVDKEVGSKASDLSKLDSEDITDLQDRYMNLERQATVLVQLGASQALFNGAKKDGAAKRAPQTYKKAELSLKNAEAVISANVRSPEGYKTAVATAVADTSLLNEVNVTINQNGKGLSEASALTMVAQNRKIKALNSDLSVSAADTAAMNQKNEKLAAELKSKGQDLDSANTNVEIQRAMESARSQFSADEADAYQQGGSLVIRLKKVNFASGGSALPGASLPILAKVSDIAKEMQASEIKVEGHTDSTGSESQNKTISEARASAVATYFKSNGFEDVSSEGFGFQKRIAPNKSKEGRAQNRRVDIIITPPHSSATL